MTRRAAISRLFPLHRDRVTQGLRLCPPSGGTSAPDEDEIGASEPWQAFEDRPQLGSDRHRVRLAGLRAPRRHLQHPFTQVDIRPLRLDASRNPGR